MDSRKKRQEKWILGTFRSSFDLWNLSFNWKAPIAPKASSNSPHLSYNFKKTEALSGSGAREETFGEQARTKTGIRRMPDTTWSISLLGPVRNKRLTQVTQLSCAERETLVPCPPFVKFLGFPLMLTSAWTHMPTPLRVRRVRAAQAAGSRNRFKESPKETSVTPCLSPISNMVKEGLSRTAPDCVSCCTQAWGGFLPPKPSLTSSVSSLSRVALFLSSFCHSRPPQAHADIVKFCNEAVIFRQETSMFSLT